MNTQKNRWLLDATLFTGFLVCFFLDLTGLSLHQWIGVIGGTAAAYHLVTHWNWVSAVMERFFGHTSNQARIYYLIDAVLLFGFTTIIGTGLVISTWLNLSLTNYAAWHTVHILASITTLAALVLKIGLHAGWIITAARKIFTSPIPQSRAVAPVAASSGMYRRDFLKLMGVVGIASLLAMSSSVQSLQAASETQEDTSSTASSTNSVTTNVHPSTGSGVSSSSQSSSACSVLCGRGCSYPGHCRRYTDSNSNGRCDLGECQA